MQLSTIVEFLADKRLNVVSEATGIHRNTLANIRDGKNTNPTLSVVTKLAQYMKASNNG